MVSVVENTYPNKFFKMHKYVIQDAKEMLILTKKVTFDNISTYKIYVA